MRRKGPSTLGFLGLLALSATLSSSGDKPTKPGGGPGGAPDTQVRVIYLSDEGERVAGDGQGAYVDSMPAGVTAELFGSGGVQGNLHFCIDDTSPRRRTLSFTDPLTACAPGPVACFGEGDVFTVSGCHNVNKFEDSDPGFLGLENDGDATNMWSPIGFTLDDGIESQLQYAFDPSDPDFQPVSVVRLYDGVWDVTSNGKAVLRRREPSGRGHQTAFANKAQYDMPFHMRICRSDVADEICLMP